MLESLISVTTPASDLTLLTITELRAAVGVTNNSQDVALNRLGTRVADAITQACKIAADGATPPTLRQESITETFRLNRWWNRRDHMTAQSELILARRPIVSVGSVVEAGVTLVAGTDFEVRPSTGILLRLFNDAPSHWAKDLITVPYVAGWATVPEGLKRAAEKLLRIYWSEIGKDPLLRSVNVPGVVEKTYWIGSPTDPSIPQDVMDDLGPYINPLA
jgi:hypothetical protein